MVPAMQIPAVWTQSSASCPALTDNWQMRTSRGPITQRKIGFLESLKGVQPHPFAAKGDEGNREKFSIFNIFHSFVRLPVKRVRTINLLSKISFMTFFASVLWSGSVGSVCLWAFWIQIRILPSLSKNSKKNLEFLYFGTSFWLFIFKDWCKWTFKYVVISKKTVKKTYILLAPCQPLTKKAGSGSEAGSISQWYGSADPDPYRNVPDT